MSIDATCNQRSDEAVFTGYVEAEYIYVAAPASRLAGHRRRARIRQGRRRRRALLFTLAVRTVAMLRYKRTLD